MTGLGQCRKQRGSAEITAEIRAVNNRHLKIQTRTSNALTGLEPKIESLVRENLRRGSLQLGVQLIGGPAVQECSLQESVIESYLQQIKNVSDRLGLATEVSVSDLLTLPGVLSDPRLAATSPIDSELEASVLATVHDALANLNVMRAAEGKSMAVELSRQLARIRELTRAIEARAPEVVEEYRKGLSTRLTKVLSEIGVKLQEADVVREVLIMADKADVREEIVRLQSHFGQFEELLNADESQGRKLDFLIQEMFREINTIGSKAGDAEIAQRVVDVKTVIEQMRELVQNVE